MGRSYKSRYINEQGRDGLTSWVPEGDMRTGPPSSSASPYKVYKALLSQSGTNAPVPTVIENTLGDVVFTRVGVGHYAATLAGAFTANKTIVFLTANGVSQFGTIISFLLNSVNIIEIKTSDASDSFAPIDGRMVGTSIEIQVYA